MESNDRAIGDVLEVIATSGDQASTTVLIVGDHGFSTIHTVMRPNRLIKDVPAKFIAAGGNAFLYVNYKGEAIARSKAQIDGIVKTVKARLAQLPPDQQQLFRIIERAELDRMGADSAAVLALAATPGLVFSGSLGPKASTYQGPGTTIQQSPLEGLFIPTTGGHHGYDPNLPDMYTGFIAAGAGINIGQSIPELRVTDIAPLIARLLGIDFPTPDGKLVPGILD